MRRKVVAHMNWLSPEEWSAVRLSAQIAVLCAVCSTPPAIFAGWFLARKNFPGKAFAESVICLPLVMPPVTVGYLLLVTLSTKSMIGGWLYEEFGLRLAFNFNAAVIASAVVSFPLYVRTVRVAIEMVDTKFEEASRQLGSGAIATFFRVTFPLAIPGILAGLVLAFARSLGEFGATITFAANIEGETRTLPLAIYSYMSIPGKENEAMKLAWISVAIALLAFVGAEYLLRRRGKPRVA